MVSSSGTVLDATSGLGIDQRTATSRLHRAPGIRKSVLVFPGATHTKNWWFDLDAATGEMRSLTDAYNFPVGSIGTLEYWGNSTIRTQVAGLRRNVNSAYATDSPVHLLGVSAGGLTALNWARVNLTRVQSIVLLIPVVNVQGVWDENRSGFKTSVNTAYGGRPGDSNNPLTNAASFSGIPIDLYYSTNDPVTTQAESETFITASGATAQNMGAVAHFWGSPWTANAAAAFFEAHDA